MGLSAEGTYRRGTELIYGSKNVNERTDIVRQNENLYLRK